jgi:hypothetical protein
MKPPIVNLDGSYQLGLASGLSEGWTRSTHHVGENLQVVHAHSWCVAPLPLVQIAVRSMRVWIVHYHNVSLGGIRTPDPAVVDMLSATASDSS